MKLGKKIPRGRRLSNPNLREDEAICTGEYSFCLWGAQWMLMNGSDRLSSSSHHEMEIDKAMKRLEGRDLVGFQIGPDRKLLRVDWGNDLQILVSLINPLNDGSLLEVSFPDGWVDLESHNGQLQLSF